MQGHESTIERFIQAQESGGSHERALAELRAGHKQGHWMWFVLPQLAGLGHSDMARRYAISDLDEARRYLGHAVLGPRLRACVNALLTLDDADPVAILGPVDSMKLRSSLTLFEAAAPAEPRFALLLERMYAGERDERTLQLLDIRP